MSYVAKSIIKKNFLFPEFIVNYPVCLPNSRFAILNWISITRKPMNFSADEHTELQHKWYVFHHWVESLFSAHLRAVHRRSIQQYIYLTLNIEHWNTHYRIIESFNCVVDLMCGSYTPRRCRYSWVSITCCYSIGLKRKHFSGMTFPNFRSQFRQTGMALKISIYASE